MDREALVTGWADIVQDFRLGAGGGGDKIVVWCVLLVSHLSCGS